MGKFKWILVCGALMAALSLNVAAAGPKADTNVFFSSHTTPAFSAVLAQLMMQQAAGEELETAISVSNTCALPSIAPVPTPLDSHISGFPECGVESTGPVWLFCFDQGGTSWSFNSSDPGTWVDDGEGNLGPVGSGLDEEGNLPAGGTWTAFMSQVVEAVTGDSANVSFVGYCYVVGQDFEAIAGTYVNFLPLVGIQQDFAMQADMMGVPIVVEDDGM